MSRKLIALSVAGLLASSAAHAAITFTVPAAIDQTVFDGQAHGLLGNVTLGGMTFSGDAWVESGVGGNSSVNWAIHGSDNAIVVGAGKTETVVFNHPQSDLLIDWDTADLYNGVQLNNGVMITGSMLSGLGFSVNPGAPAGNLFLDISNFGSDFTQATFYSTSDSFEFKLNSDAGSIPGTPEASTWLMVLMGFTGLFFAANRKVKTARAVA